MSGTEFVCAQNYTTDPYGGAPLGAAATFAAMRAWNINVIRLPLNEDCWLDISGVEVGGAAYQAAIEAEVSAAHSAGLFVILDLHWTAPGLQRALSQNPEPDADHSPAFWTSLAATFAADPGVIFDLFNEPYDYWGTDADPWNGWLNGDVQKQYVTGGTPYTVTATWQTAGMQQLVTAVRATGATQPILVNGLDWANDDSGWLAHAPSDPLGQIIAGAHIYPTEACATTACWDGVYPAIGAKYPVLIGESGDSTAAPVAFYPTFMPYADSHGWSDLAWDVEPLAGPGQRARHRLARHAERGRGHGLEGAPHELPFPELSVGASSEAVVSRARPCRSAPLRHCPSPRPSLVRRTPLSDAARARRRAASMPSSRCRLRTSRAGWRASSRSRRRRRASSSRSPGLW